jgi:HTH-type transcriptional regulator/antitoxin HigA
MAKTRTAPDATHVAPGDRYLDLIGRFPLRPIRSDEELERAITAIDALIDQDERDRDEEDYLEVLGDLVERYESEHHPMPPVSDADMLRHLIEARETTQARVATETGISESTVSEVLAGKRKLNRRHIEALSRHFKVSPAVFISEPGR